MIDGQSLAEPGSFRDRDSRVFIADGGVFRALSARGLEDFEALQATTLFARAVKDGKLVRTELHRDTQSVPEGLLPEAPAGVLEHERIPMISYPYEWTFGMLKDAALLHLELIDAAMAEGLTMKDASPYNVQFTGARPTFADIGSFEPLRRDEPWIGYRQFCTMFLYPLMLQAYRDVDFQLFLKGSLEGITPPQAAALLPKRGDGILTHVRLHARLERRQDDTSVRETRKEMSAAGFKSEIVRANLQKMHKLVTGLKWDLPKTAWTDYGDNNRGYDVADRNAKEAFVRTAAQRVRPRVTWDLGTNDGVFARIAAEHSEHVVASDFDHATVEHLYQALKGEGDTKILPLVIDVCDPSPARGWRNAERQTLEGRGRPDLTLSLALLHHLSITRNVPVRDLIAWLADLGGTHVIEFPLREDAMVQRLLAAKRDESHPDWDLEHFEGALAERFDIHVREALGTRVLFEATSKG